MSKAIRQPAIFLAHGDPMNALRDNDFTRTLAAIGASLPEPPRAVLVVSAHWESRGTLACAAARPETIHDFGGFPAELYRVEYPAPGAPGLAREAVALVPGARETSEWGLDHGAWTVLRHAFPAAEVPVFEVSIDSEKTLREQFEIGRALAPLREEGVLFVGSGNVVHNLGRIAWGGPAYPWAEEFDAWVGSRLEEGDMDALCDLSRGGEAARDAVAALACPTLEHYSPLVYAMGAAGSGARASFPYLGFEHGSLSMRCVAWE
jgi:4,5-DOPA dioxygenase extradiol